MSVSIPMGIEWYCLQISNQIRQILNPIKIERFSFSVDNIVIYTVVTLIWIIKRLDFFKLFPLEMGSRLTLVVA